MARYHVKSATMKIGSNTFEMANGPAAKSQTREAVEVTALSDSVKQFIPGALVEEDEVTVTIYDPGTGRPSVTDEAAKIEFSVTLSNGKSPDVTAAFSYEEGIVTKVSAPSQDATGDRKATLDVTIRPSGKQASA